MKSSLLQRRCVQPSFCNGHCQLANFVVVVVVTLFQFQKLQIFQIWQQMQTNKFVSVSLLFPNEMPVSMLIIHMQLISAMVSIS